MSDTKEFQIWMKMISRCTLPSNPAFKNYGGRGINVCERWMKFENFYEDMGKCPGDLTLERIDNNRNYDPGNCRWASRTEQANNRRSNRLLTFNGKTQTIMQWSRETGLKRTTIEQRLDSYGYSIEQALTTTPAAGGRHGA